MAQLDTIAVVGASLAGLRGVEALRARGYAGRIHWIGAEAHPPYDRPPLSKEVLRGEWEPDRIRLRRDGLADLQVELHLGRRAVALDLHRRRLTLEGGGELAFDGLFVATGAEPLALAGVPLEGVHLLRTLDDALAIRAALERRPRVAVVGGGFIGAEVAASCRQRGLEVALIEALEQPLAQSLGTELGAWCAALHRERGVALRLEARVAALEGAQRVERVRLDDGSALEADLVVVGIGVRPATGWLAGSGLTLDDGVVCDASCAAADRVVAAGDVARWESRRYGGRLRVEHWDHAVNQAEAAAVRLLSDPEHAEAFDPVPFVWSDQYDAKIQVAGLPRPGDALHWIEGSAGAPRFVVLTSRAGRWTGVVAVNRAARFIHWRQALEAGLSLEDALERGRRK